MAYDETFDPLPRYSDRELYEIVEVREGRLRPLEGVINLERVETSPAIEAWSEEMLHAGEPVSARVSYDLVKDDEFHTVAWVGRVGLGYSVVCDCVERGPISDFGYREDTFNCEAVATAINARGDYARTILHNEDYLKRHGDYETIRGMVQFLLAYSESNPDTWLASHRSGVGLIGGLAQTFGRSYEEMDGMARAMQIEGAIELSGPHQQVVSLPRAA